jgi:hypothetical protein
MMDLIIYAQQLHTICDSAPENSWDHYILPKYVNWYTCQIEQAEVWLHKKDVISVNLWIDQLKEKNICKTPEGLYGSTWTSSVCDSNGRLFIWVAASWTWTSNKGVDLRVKDLRVKS